MAVLIIGGTGKVGARLVPILQSANIPFLVATRRGTIPSDPFLPATKFDWEDESTYKNPFEHQFPNGEKITAAYVIAPYTQDPVDCMNAFIDFAVQKGVKRFVMMSGTSLKKDGHHTGKVWQHMDDIGVRYNVLLATWINENFSEGQHAASIKNESKIYTACGDARVPFVSSKDIASVVFHCLTDEKVHPEMIRVIGPELLTYDEAAANFSKVLGREVVHVKLSAEERKKSYLDLGFPDYLAGYMTMIEQLTAGGLEDFTNNSVEEVTGSKPQKFSDWVEENQAVWKL